MKRKLIIAGVTGLVLIGGAISVAAYTEQEINKKVITLDKAEEIANSKVVGSIDSIELEREHGRLEYHVDVQGQNGEEIEVEMDAVTGEVIKVKNDDDDNNNTVTTTNTTSGVKLTKEEAIAIATKDTAGKVVKFEYEEGQYEIEIHTDTHEIDFEIDAQTGRILEKDMDSFDDDDRYDD